MGTEITMSWAYNRRFRPSYNPSQSFSPPSTTERSSDPSFGPRLKALLENPIIKQNTKEVAFLSSMLTGFERYGSLSGKQIDCLTKKEEQNDSKNMEAKRIEQDDWIKNYDSVKKKNAFTIASWYKLQSTVIDRGLAPPFYFQAIAEKVLSNNDIVLSKNEYEKMVGNNHATRYLSNLEIPSSFKSGDIVTTVSRKLSGFIFPYETALVIEVKRNSRNKKKNFTITVLPTGTDQIRFIEEDQLKLVR